MNVQNSTNAIAQMEPEYQQRFQPQRSPAMPAVLNPTHPAKQPDPIAELWHEQARPHQGSQAGQVSDADAAEVIAQLRERTMDEGNFYNRCTRHPEWLDNHADNCSGCRWDAEADRYYQQQQNRQPA